MGAVKALLMDAEEGDPAAIETMRRIEALNRAELERLTAAGLRSRTCAACGGTGEVIHEHEWGPEWDAAEPCRVCGEWGRVMVDEDGWTYTVDEAQELAADPYPAAPPSLPLEAYEGEEAHHV